MSLDVYLEIDTTVWHPSETIPVRANGTIVELTREQWDQLYPDREPVVLQTEGESTVVFSWNITHNLARMAEEAGLYLPCWRPEELNIEKAEQLVALLDIGLEHLHSDPERFKQLNPLNGWGDYEGLVAFVEAYLAASLIYPKAQVRVSR